MNDVPKNINVPGQYVSISNVRAITGLSGIQSRIVLYGQKLTSGTAQVEQFLRVSSKEDAQKQFGAGSMLALMFEKFFLNNKLTEAYAVALADADASTKATFAVQLSGTATSAGTMFLYIDGVLVSVGVSIGDTAAQIAAKIDAAVNANPNLPVTSFEIEEQPSGSFLLQAKNAGTVMGQTDVRFNYNNEQFPAGIILTSITPVAGATDPNLDDAISATPDIVISMFVSPYQDSTNIGKMKLEITDRFGPLKQLEGHCVIGKAGTFSEVATFGQNFNDKHLSIWDAGYERPCAAYLQTAGFAGVSIESLSDDPARPLQTLEVAGILPEIQTNERLFNERNQLTDSGISTNKVDAGGNIVIERGVTTYLVNSSNARDKSFQSIHTMFTSSYLRQTLIAYVASRYPRHKLGDDGVRYGASQPVVTPKLIKGSILSWFLLLEKAALVENYEQFQKELSVVRDIRDGGNDPNRVNAVLPTDYINQFIVFAGEIQFII